MVGSGSMVVFPGAAWFTSGFLWRCQTYCWFLLVLLDSPLVFLSVLLVSFGAACFFVGLQCCQVYCLFLSALLDLLLVSSGAAWFTIGFSWRCLVYFCFVLALRGLLLVFYPSPGGGLPTAGSTGRPLTLP